MATDAIIILERLRCIRESDGTGHSEPYIWPVLLRIDDLTLQTESHVEVVAPRLGNARVVIKNDIRAGQTADIPTSVGVLRVRLEASLFLTRLILVVALWEEDETPDAAVRAGFQAFVSELGAAIGNINTLIALKEADDKKDAEALAAIIATIKSQVENRVKSAIANGLTGPQKARVFIGTLNLDDPIGNGFKPFPNAIPTPITLTFGKGSSNDYEIQGRLEVRPIRVDRCQAQVNAVTAVQSVVDGIDAEIRQHQTELQQASPGEKPFIISEIKRIREGELADATAALGQAHTALSICRSRIPTFFPDTVVAIASGQA